MSADRVPGARGGRASGFTLVELLVVISIIGLLISLLMPAVQAARESGRRLTCANNCYQMARACLMHETMHGFLPSSGWGWQWAGDPRRGFNTRQPGGWHYNILPYLEQSSLHDAGMDGDKFDKEQGRVRAQTPIATFICPTRHKLQSFPRDHGTSYINVNDPKPIIGRSDYAANSGDGNTGVDPGGPNPNYDDQFKWADLNGGASTATGVSFRASTVPMAAVKDGASCTYLLGERYLCPDNYMDHSGCDNDQGWDTGYDYDVNRWTTDPPAQDRPGWGGCMTIFGAAHSAGFHMAFCDGSVHRISYGIDRETHRRLGNRKDGQVVDMSEIR